MKFSHQKGLVAVVHLANEEYIRIMFAILLTEIGIEFALITWLKQMSVSKKIEEKLWAVVGFLITLITVTSVSIVTLLIWM